MLINLSPEIKYLLSSTSLSHKSVRWLRKVGTFINNFNINYSIRYNILWKFWIMFYFNKLYDFKNVNTFGRI